MQVMPLDQLAQPRSIDRPGLDQGMHALKILGPASLQGDGAQKVGAYDRHQYAVIALLLRMHNRFQSFPIQV